MVLAVDLSNQPTQTIYATTLDAANIDLNLGNDGTLIFDGATSQIDSIAGIGAVSNTTIELLNGASVTVNAALANVAAGSTFNYDIGAGTQLNLVQPTVGAGIGNNTTINFQNTGGTGSFTFTPNLANLSLGTLPTIAGLSAGDQVDVVGATSATLAGGVLTFTYPSAIGIPATASFNVVGMPANASVSFDAGTGAAVFACFLRGTRVATPGGEVAIEDLRMGDEVLTLDHGRSAIKWIGRRMLEPSTVHPAKAGLPVRVRQHAIAENVPHRDLLLSPDHSLLLDGVLIPVKLLINGMTIVQEYPTATFEYLHLELEQHDVIMVEGALAETYIDMGNRQMFGTPGVVHFHLDAKVGDWSQYCYPPVYDGEKFDAVYVRIEAQAERLGYRPATALAS